MHEKIYACEPDYLLTYLTKIENASAEEITLAAGQYGSDHGDDDPLDDIYEEDGEEACIKVEGPLTQAEPSALAKFFGFGGTSYASILKAVDRAKENFQIKGIRLAVNSPGGEVAGVDHVWQALRGCGKNCTAENHGLMASAAYWLSCACDKITAMSPAAETGSIGVVAVGIDDSDLMKNLGVKKVTILSKNAPDKSYDFSTAKGRSSIQARADEVESVFLSRVAEGRGKTVEDVKANFGQGRLKIAMHQDGNPCACAMHCGMIDAVTPMTPDTASRQQAGFKVPHTTINLKTNGGKHMTLVEFLASEPGAKADYDKAILAATTSGRAEMQAIAKRVGKYLTAEVYAKSPVISAQVVKALSGEATAESVENAVTMYDLITEQQKQAAAVKETQTIGETPPLAQSAGAELVAKAQTLKIDIAATEAYAKSNGIDPTECLKAAIQTAEQKAADDKLLGVAPAGA